MSDSLRWVTPLCLERSICHFVFFLNIWDNNLFNNMQNWKLSVCVVRSSLGGSSCTYALVPYSQILLTYFFQSSLLFGSFLRWHIQLTTSSPVYFFIPLLNMISAHPLKIQACRTAAIAYIGIVGVIAHKSMAYAHICPGLLAGRDPNPRIELIQLFQMHEGKAYPWENIQNVWCLTRAENQLINQSTEFYI